MTNIWGADWLWCLSKFHVEQFLSVAADLKPIMHRTRNGVDLDFIKEIEEGRDAGDHKRDEHLYIWGSRPERGLDILLQHVWPRILKDVDPKATLLVAGYSDAGIEIPEHVKMFYKHVDALLASTPRVERVGYLPKRKWYEFLMKGQAVLYPTKFPEISCINAMEAQACGIPIITSNEFALKETVKDKHNLIDGHPLSEEYQLAFVSRVARLLKDKSEYKLTQRLGKDHILKHYEWKTIAEEWVS